MNGNLFFNAGGSAIRFANYPSFNKFIIEFNIISKESYSGIRGIFSNKPDTSYTNGFQVYIINNHLAIQSMYNNVDSDLVNSEDMNINDGKIHKCRFIIDNESVICIFDNKQILLSNMPIDLNTGMFEIGGLTYNNYTDSRGFYNGLIGNVRIYEDTELKSYYPINEGQGNTIVDHGSLKLNGILIGSTYSWLNSILFKNNKYLIKQNNQYYSIKPEFYQDGQFTPLTLSGEDKPNDDDYNNKGFDDINTLCTKYNTEDYISSGEVLSEGKLFTFNIPSDMKNINNIE